MSYRDTLKTIGAIRAAAFALACPEYGGKADPTELHDSLCKALPGPSDTPVSVSRCALELLDALKGMVAAFGDITITVDGVVQPETDPEIIAARAAIAKATGAA